MLVALYLPGDLVPLPALKTLLFIGSRGARKTFSLRAGHNCLGAERLKRQSPSDQEGGRPSRDTNMGEATRRGRRTGWEPQLHNKTMLCGDVGEKASLD